MCLHCKHNAYGTFYWMNYFSQACLPHTSGNWQLEVTNVNNFSLQVDCTEAGKETCNRFSVSGYPTLKIFKGGEISADYNGPREASKLIRWSLDVCECS